MAKITSKASLTLGTNYRYHLVDKQGTDIAISQTNDEITSSSTDFTASTTVSGIVKREIRVGDILTIANTGSAANEGVTAEVNSVAANTLGVTWLTGTPVDEAAGADINITAFVKEWEFIEAGGLSFVDGVEGIVWASKTVDDWDTGNLDIYPRIFTSVEPRAKSLAALNGWRPLNTDTVNAQRDSALEVRPDANSAATQIYALLRSSDLDESTDQMYVWSSNDAELDAPTAAVMTGYINQLFLILDSENAIDDRGEWNFRCLEAGKTHLQGTVDANFAEIYPVSSNNGIDPKLADGSGQFVDDVTVAAGGIYADVLLNEDVDSQYDGDVDGTLRSFLGYVDADSQSNETVHTKIHYLLRQPTNVNNDGTGRVIRGDKAPAVTSFLGDQMTVDQYYLLNFNAAQRNFLRVVSDNGTTYSWPITRAILITSPQLGVGGTFSLIHKDTYGASSPTYLQDESGVPQQDIAITASTTIIVAFSTYNVDGHTAGTALELVLTWNKPNAIEPDFNDTVVLNTADITVPITPTADPSYTTA